MSSTKRKTAGNKKSASSKTAGQPTDQQDTHDLPTHRNKIVRRETKSNRRDDQQVSLLSGGPVENNNNAAAILQQQMKWSSLPPSTLVSQITPEEEVDYLSTLNKRLEFLLAFNKATDCNIVTQISDLKTENNSYKNEIQSLAARAGTKLVKQAEEIGELTIDVQRQLEEAEALALENDHLRQQLQNKTDELANIKASTSNINENMQEFEDQIALLEKQNATLNTNVQKLKKDKADLVAKLNSTDDNLIEISDSEAEDDEEDENAMDDSTTTTKRGRKSTKKQPTKGKKQVNPREEISRLRAKLITAKQLEALNDKQHQQELDLLAKQIKQSYLDEQEYAEDTKAQIQEALAKQEKLHEQQLEDLRKELEKEMKSRGSQQSNLLQSYEKQIEGLQATKNILENQITTLTRTVATTTAERDTLLQQYEEVRDDLDESVKNHKHDIALLEKQKHKLQQSILANKAKDDELNAIKQALQTEIGKYDTILGVEEVKHGLSSATKTGTTAPRQSARRAAPRASAARRAQIAQDDDAEEEQQQDAPQQVPQQATPKRRSASRKQ